MAGKIAKKNGKGYEYPMIGHMVGLEGKIQGERKKLLAMADKRCTNRVGNAACHVKRFLTDSGYKNLYGKICQRLLDSNPFGQVHEIVVELSWVRLYNCIHV